MDHKLTEEEIEALNIGAIRYAHILEEKTRPGKPYREYLREAKSRTQKAELRPWIRNRMQNESGKRTKTRKDVEVS